MKKNTINIRTIKQIIIIILIAIINITLTYGAFIAIRVQTKNNELSSGCFSTTLTNESKSINITKAIPDSDGLNSNVVPYSFTINNTCSIDANYYVIVSSKADSFTTEYIDYQYGNGDKLNLANAEFNTLGTDTGYSDSRIIGSGTLISGNSTTINIRLWLNENADYNVIHGSTWNGQIKVISKAFNN